VIGSRFSEADLRCSSLMWFLQSVLKCTMEWTIRAIVNRASQPFA